jgi:hypothetical protein
MLRLDCCGVVYGVLGRFVCYGGVVGVVFVEVVMGLGEFLFGVELFAHVATFGLSS